MHIFVNFFFSGKYNFMHFERQYAFLKGNMPFKIIFFPEI